MAPKPDDRKDNVKKIQYNIDRTIENTRMADDMIAHTSDPKAKEDLMDKNARRNHALDDMREEIKDEAKHKKDVTQHQKKNV
jgi:small acid-soluble spore protein (thioredoxin-like protein)